MIDEPAKAEGVVEPANDVLRLRLDGEEVELHEVPPLQPLLDLLRGRLGRTSVRRGCGDGQCGACTVLLDGLPVCACLVPSCQALGSEIDTAEGLAASGALDALQQALVESGGVQCGFCTPGLLISAYALISSNAGPSRDEVRSALAGNLCRCTGYHSVVDAVILAAGAMQKVSDES